MQRVVSDACRSELLAILGLDEARQKILVGGMVCGVQAEIQEEVLLVDASNFPPE